MPRRSSRGRSARPAARSPPPQKVFYTYSDPPPAHAKSKSSSRGSMFGAIAQGMAFGIGNAVAHRAVDRIMGPRTIQHETVGSEVAAAPASAASSLGESDACGVQNKAFQDCLYSSGSEISKCQSYMDMLAECRRNSGSMMSS